MSNPWSVRRAVLALTLSAPLALAPAAGAAGDDAVVGATVSSGNVHVTSTKGLSRVTVVLCGGDTIVADSWGGEQKAGDVGVTGTVQAVFVHSGNNTSDAAQALLAQLAGADEVKGNSTGAIAFYSAHACDPPSSSSSTTTSSTTTSSTTTTTTDTPPTTIVTTDTPPPDEETTTSTTNQSTTTTTSGASGTTTTTATTPTTVGQTVVLGETLERSETPAPSLAPAVSPATLARTGAGQAMFLVTLASALIAAGAALLSVFRRRRADSASSPC